MRILLLFLFLFPALIHGQALPLDTKAQRLAFRDLQKESRRDGELNMLDLNVLITNCRILLGREMHTKEMQGYRGEHYRAFSGEILTAEEFACANPSGASIEKIVDHYSALITAKDAFKVNLDREETIMFVGTGDIQKSLNEGSALPANTGFGVYYVRNFGNQGIGFSRFEVEASVNVASTVDSIKAVWEGVGVGRQLMNQSDFGNSVLLPINSGQAAYFNLVTYFKGHGYDGSRNTIIPGIISGLQLNITSSNRNWSVDNEDVQLTTFALKVGAFKEFFPFGAERREYEIKIGMNFTLNRLFGDVAHDPELLNQVLNTSRKSYPGLETFIGIRVMNLRGEIGLPIVFKGDEHVSGLTGGRLITRIRFIGGFPIRLWDRYERR